MLLQEPDGFFHDIGVGLTGHRGKPARGVMEQSQGEGIVLGQLGQEPLARPIGGLPLSSLHRAGVIDQQDHLPGHAAPWVMDRWRCYSYPEKFCPLEYFLLKSLTVKTG